MGSDGPGPAEGSGIELDACIESARLNTKGRSPCASCLSGAGEPLLIVPFRLTHDHTRSIDSTHGHSRAAPRYAEEYRSVPQVLGRHAVPCL